MSVTIVTKFNNIPKVDPVAQGLISASLNNANKTLVSTADPLTRVDRGWLKGRKRIKNASPGSQEASTKWVQEYAGYQNGGTVKMSGTHFADTGVATARPAMIAEMNAIGSKLA